MSANPLKSDLNLVGDSVLEVAEALGLSREQLANTIGVSVPTIARMKRGAPVPGNKPFEMALLLIRIYRALYAIVGGDLQAMQHWMTTPNKHFSEQSGQPRIPSEMIQSIEGLTRVLWYLDAIRGRL
jgi:transcriptional regulator with XRE-family HTH domain